MLCSIPKAQEPDRCCARGDGKMWKVCLKSSVKFIVVGMLCVVMGCEGKAATEEMPKPPAEITAPSSNTGKETPSTLGPTETKETDAGRSSHADDVLFRAACQKTSVHKWPFNPPIGTYSLKAVEYVDQSTRLTLVKLQLERATIDGKAVLPGSTAVRACKLNDLSVSVNILKAE
ncbi:MAG: hypothetical protein IH991_05525 [Planctomycetes bacterium]|nr:hypothetical protein [Planctomycetota bacterium]